MKSIAFPNMVSNTTTKIFDGHEATLSNLKLLLLSDRGTLFGDPYYGTKLKKLLFDQNNSILKDILIDDIYSSIVTFMPQMFLERKNITITSKNKTVYINIRATNLLDQTTDLYSISLMGSEEV